MNDRIEKLFEQALEEFKAENKYDNATIIVPNPMKEKFAELIIKECAKVAVHKPDGLWYTGTDAGLVSAGRMTAAQLIKEHFGVE